MRRTILIVLGAAIICCLQMTGQTFYPDDPLQKEPPPFHVESANYRALSALYEVIDNIFSDPGERHPASGVIPAMGVNTLGEVMDGAWFVNRHARKRLTTDELVRGSGDQMPPSLNEPWRVLTVRKYDVRPGMLIHDSKNDLYLLRFDPPGHPEMSTGAGIIGSKLFYAMGYWVAENYIVHFERSQLVVSPEGEEINAVGRATRLVEDDIDLFLGKVSRDPRRGYRAIAIRVPRAAKIIGPYQFYGTRRDDPNDTVSHEHRRDLRGLFLISAWLANNAITPLHTTDALITEGDSQYIRHYFVDFFTMLGSGLQREKRAYEGSEPLLDIRAAGKNFATFGLWAPGWERAKHPGLPAVGLFEAEVFDPSTWQPNFESAPFANRLPDDDYWAARQIVAFSDEDIQAIVKTAEYSDPAAEEWIAKTLMARRDKVGRYAFDRVLPLDNFRVESGRLRFDDLAVAHGYRPAVDYAVEWYEFDNPTRDMRVLFGMHSFELPDRVLSSGVGAYWAAKIAGKEPGKALTAFLRREESGFKVVGIERDWPGKAIATPSIPKGQQESRYTKLSARQKELFDTYIAEYNRKTGFNLTPEQGFLTITLSERTTFDAITHALSQSELTGSDGKSLGRAVDLVESIERIAGQYYGRQGDEQFRLYVRLRPDAKETLEKAKEFSADEENTVYHIGYPHSYRQAGKVPNIQFSLSEDGLRADIDVDYRSSKLPESMWNGHLTSANSDVRQGDNYPRHNNRWAGLVNWWQAFLGPRGAEPETTDMMARIPAETPIPLPPDRPAGAQVAAVQDAVQELLTDWLVRHKFDEALEWISDDALACAEIDETEKKTLSMAEMRSRIREIMQGSAERGGKAENLTQVIDGVIPWRKALRVVDQPFAGDFTIVEVPDAFAASFKCEMRTREAMDKALTGSDLKYGNYYGAIFRIKTGPSQGAVLGMLWTKQQGRWRLTAWEVYRP